MSQPTDLRKLLIELRDFLRDRNHSMWSYVESGTQAEDMANLADRIDAALAEVVEPIHQLEHWAEYWNGSANEKAMSDALEHILGEVDDLLRAAQEAK